MLKRAARQPWTCARCLRLQQRRYFNGLAEAAKANYAADIAPATHDAPDAKYDDKTLRQIFDSQPFWKEFSQHAKHHGSGQSAGLFQNRYLTKPDGFQKFAHVTLQKCMKLVDKVLAASTVDEFKSLAKDLDRLSDLLCRVIDLSDFVRATHPDRKVQAAATQAYAMMFEYMNKLNTTTGLNDQLKKASQIPEVWDSWTEEEQVVAQILMKDFSKSAIDLPEGARNRFVELSNDITNMGTDFVDNMAPEMSYLHFDSSKLKGMDPTVVRNFTKWGKVTLPTVGMPAMMALRTVEDADVRREIYMANRTASKGSIRRLEAMLKSRAALAKLSGHDTFAHMALGDKMAKTPEAVNQFLSALAADNYPRVQSELEELLELKESDAKSGNFPASLNAWDRDYYTTRLLSSMQTRIRSPDYLSAYFSLGTVLQGLSRLFSRLYGVRLVPREAAPGETWNDDVRRLDVIDEVEGHIAVVYCDLFSRPGKNPNPAHFTLRCSRVIQPTELEEADSTTHPFDTAIEAATDGMAAAYSPSSGKLHQLPTIALICDFARSTQRGMIASSKPTLLTFRDVQTLFHEMGHAIHSILGRTTLQNVSGTRCATDFAELPSVLMEHFAAAPEVLGLYARHWETDAPLPYRLVEERLALDRRMSGAETESQILLAMLDQAYHGPLPMQPRFDSTETYHHVFNKHSAVPEPRGTAWQGFFGHLFGYGATYYAYLFDRAIAGKVWKDVFQRTAGGAVERDAGQKFREEVLMWGGGRDPWKCVAGVLEDERLAEGGERAMKEVGKWGVGE
ncbi:Mitochondrial intermediate peptidase [Coniosporium apollinis]|uniref:Mitochondrial intermediate peptidase n=2 Tax=Coniosporium TaxID=2810619 RepID=A0ABQ9NGF2_9PEZI|nr:Mitochondrial intermediate peptidase [Cladosporium sp. JES 115]KAJ9656964.1 Mitochondrial intermediate peptidase [Coniosporium apollinis]